jgi:hypothetical protein
MNKPLPALKARYRIIFRRYVDSYDFMYSSEFNDYPKFVLIGGSLPDIQYFLEL